jgi:formamidopyrimidine-DNA glycosylase
MPELPEVEVVRQFLDQNIVGKTITNFKVLNPKSFIGQPQQLKHQTIVGTSRLGKQLSLHLKNDLILLFHLKMTGQIIFGDSVLGHPTPKEDKSHLPNKSTRLVFTFSDGTIMYFNDQRKFGWVKLFTPKKLAQFQQSVGLDLLDPEFTPTYFFNQLQSSRRPIKIVLLDQQKFAGTGNIYANDALFLSQIHPQTPANQLTFPQSKNLYKNLIKLIKESIRHGGSTAKDNKYIRPDGSFGQHQYHFRVYQRQGEPCSICHTPIVRISLGGRGTFYCPHCQPLLLK